MILYGTLYQKGNSRKIVINRRTRKPMVIKNDKVLREMEFMIIQAKAAWGGQPPLKGDVTLTATIFYPNRRHDLDDSLLCDILQAAGVIRNDRQIAGKVLRKMFDKNNPRVEVTVCQQK